MSQQINRPRESLKLIQSSANQPNSLVGNSRQPMQSLQKKRNLSKSEIVKKSKVTAPGGFTVFEDTKRSVEVQTEQPITRDINADDLTSEEAGVDYWKTLAECRRVALDDSLRENEMLHGQVSKLNDRVSVLEAEQEQHEELKVEAGKLAETVKILAAYLGDDEDNTYEATDMSHVPKPLKDRNSSHSCIDTEDRPVETVVGPPRDKNQQVVSTEQQSLSDQENKLSPDTDRPVFDTNKTIDHPQYVAVASSIDIEGQVLNTKASEDSLSPSPVVPTTISYCQSSPEEAIPTVLNVFPSSPGNDINSPSDSLS